MGGRYRSVAVIANQCRHPASSVSWLPPLPGQTGPFPPCPSCGGPKRWGPGVSDRGMIHTQPTRLPATCTPAPWALGHQA